jgi:hypothetical protein
MVEFVSMAPKLQSGGVLKEVQLLIKMSAWKARILHQNSPRTNATGYRDNATPRDRTRDLGNTG